VKRPLFYLSLFLVPFFAKADSYPINYSIELKHYAFEINLSDKTDEIRGIATLTIKTIKEGNKDLAIDLIQKTEGRNGRGMIVDSVMISGIPVHYTLDEDHIFIHLDQASPKGVEISLKISYHGIPREGLLIGKTQFGKRSFFSDNWPNKARSWLATLDHPYYKASSEFIVKAPSHYQVISNGLLVEETNIDSITKLTHWKQSLPVSCWLYNLGVADFAVQFYDTLMGKSLQTWVFPENREAGFYDFSEVTKKSVRFFSDYIGPYVYEKIANIQTASVAGGMEASSAIFYAQNLITGKRTVRLRNVVIHEFAHQWFGNSVTEKSWDEVWLSEGFATFFTLLFIENEYGKEEYRNGIIQSRNTIYQTAKKLPGFKIIDNRNPEKEEVTSAITYQKGAWTLHMLRNLLGEENFKKGIREYYRTYINGHATTGDFQEIMEKVSGKKLGAFFDQWLRHGENPELTGNWKWDSVKKTLKVHLEQIQSGDYVFNLPVEIGLKEKGKEELKIIKLNLKTKTLDQEIYLETQPVKVIFDPRIILLAQIKGNFEE
jgi:aminopeptidase N